MASILDTGVQLVKDNKSTLIGGAIGVGVGAAVGSVATAAIIGSKARKKRKKSSTKKRKSSRKSKRNKRKYYPEPKGRKHSRRKIRTTKSGQPYIILASGKARFIKKSSARLSRKKKGGRY